MIIDVKNDFSSTPGPRYKEEGDFSGEVFRQTILLPKIIKSIDEREKLIIKLDGTDGFGTSFLEESFGGLIREDHLKYEDIIDVLELISIEEPYLIEDINEYLKEAKIEAV